MRLTRGLLEEADSPTLKMTKVTPQRSLAERCKGMGCEMTRISLIISLARCPTFSGKEKLFVGELVTNQWETRAARENVTFFHVKIN